MAFEEKPREFFPATPPPQFLVKQEILAALNLPLQISVRMCFSKELTELYYNRGEIKLFRNAYTIFADSSH